MKTLPNGKHIQLKPCQRETRSTENCSKLKLAKYIETCPNENSSKWKTHSTETLSTRDSFN